MVAVREDFQGNLEMSIKANHFVIYKTNLNCADVLLISLRMFLNMRGDNNKTFNWFIKQSLDFVIIYAMFMTK